MTSGTKSFFVSSLLIALALVAAFVLFSFHVIRSGEKLSEMVDLIANAEAREAQVNELLRLLEATAADREALDQFILVEDDVIDFLSSIEAIAGSKNLRFSTESLEVVKFNDNYNALEVLFKSAGTDEDIVSLLTILEALPYKSEVTRFSLSTSQSSSEAEFEGLFALRVYLKK